MVTVKNLAGNELTISEDHWSRLKEYQASHTADPNQVYKLVEKPKKSEEPKKDKS